MALVEGILGEFLPFCPYFLENLFRVAVFLAAFEEQLLQGVHLVDELLTHRLAQGVALASGEVGEQSRQQHDLLLINRDAVGVFQIHLHLRNVVGYRLAPLFAGDEVGNVVHRSRPVEGVHRYEVFEGRGLELAQIFLHIGRLELERSDCAAFAVKLIGFGVFEADVVDVDVFAGGELDIVERLFYYRKCLKPQEVHFYEAGVFDDAALILGYDQLVLLAVGALVDGGRNRHPVGYVVAADDDSAGMDARVAHISFESPRKFKHLLDQRLTDGQLMLELRHVLIAVFQRRFQLLAVNLGHVGRDERGQPVALAQRQLLDAGNVFDGQLSSHCAVSDDMGNLFFAVFPGDIAQNLFAAVVVEVDVDIWERDSVGIQEALEKEVIFYGVDLGYSEAVGHTASGCRSSAGADADAEFLAGRADEILHDEEVAREAHRLHYMELEHDSFFQLGRYLAIAFFSAFPGEFGQIVCLEFYAVELLVASEFVDLLPGIFG